MEYCDNRLVEVLFPKAIEISCADCGDSFKTGITSKFRHAVKFTCDKCLREKQCSNFNQPIGIALHNLENWRKQNA